MEIAVIQDKIIPLKDVPEPYSDRGTFFGDGVYEVIRSYNGKIFALEDHLSRFKRSMFEIGINGINVETVKETVLSAFESAKIANAKIYFHVTRGSGPRSHDWSEEMRPNFYMTITEVEDSAELKQKGVAVCAYPDLRWKRCDIKSLNLLPNVLAHKHATDRGFYEAILYNENGFITEGSSSAFFEIFDGALVTTPLEKNILPSITRKYVIKAAKNVGMQIKERQITTEQAKEADELFMAVTTKDIIGVVRFEEAEISGGKVGACTGKLMAEFKKFLQ